MSDILLRGYLFNEGVIKGFEDFGFDNDDMSAGVKQMAAEETECRTNPEIWSKSLTV